MIKFIRKYTKRTLMLLSLLAVIAFSANIAYANGIELIKTGEPDRIPYSGDIQIYDIDWTQAVIQTKDSRLYVKNHEVWGNADGNPTHYDGYTLSAKNVGHTSDGRTLDVVIDVSDITINPENYSSKQPYEFIKNSGGIKVLGWQERNGKFYNWFDSTTLFRGMKQRFTITLYESGTNKKVDGEFVIKFADIDMGTYNDSQNNVYDGGDWSEGITFVNPSNNTYYVGARSDIFVQEKSNGVRFAGKSYVDPKDSEPEWNVAGVAKVVRSGAEFVWSGTNCWTLIDPSSTNVVYPTTSNPEKTTDEETNHRYGDTIDFEITHSFPYVSPYNKAKSIQFYDNLDDVLDASNSTMQVFKGDKNVTGEWIISTENNAMLATAKDASQVQGDYRFVIHAKSKQSYPLQHKLIGIIQSYDNTAKLIINAHTIIEKPTNTVTYKFKEPAHLKLHKSAT